MRPPAWCPAAPLVTNRSRSRPFFLVAALHVRLYDSDPAKLTVDDLLHWLAWHRYGGVEKVFVYDAHLRESERFGGEPRIRAAARSGFLEYVDWGAVARRNVRADGSLAGKHVAAVRARRAGRSRPPCARRPRPRARGARASRAPSRPRARAATPPGRSRRRRRPGARRRRSGGRRRPPWIRRPRRRGPRHRRSPCSRRGPSSRATPPTGRRPRPRSRGAGRRAGSATGRGSAGRRRRGGRRARTSRARRRSARAARNCGAPSRPRTRSPP